MKGRIWMIKGRKVEKGREDSEGERWMVKGRGW